MSYYPKASAKCAAILVVLLASILVGFGQAATGTALPDFGGQIVSSTPVKGEVNLDREVQKVSEAPVQTMPEPKLASKSELETAPTAKLRNEVFVVNNYNNFIRNERERVRAVYRTDSTKLNGLEARLNALESRVSEHGRYIHSLLATKVDKSELAAFAAANAAAARPTGGPLKPKEKEMDSNLIIAAIIAAFVLIAVALIMRPQPQSPAQPHLRHPQPGGLRTRGLINLDSEATEASLRTERFEVLPNGGFDHVVEGVHQHTGRR